MTHSLQSILFLGPLSAAFLLGGVSNLQAQEHPHAQEHLQAQGQGALSDPDTLPRSEANPLRTEVTYGTVLSTYVDPTNALVDYQALQADRALLDEYVDALATVDEAMYESWSNEEKIAYWINAYNSITLQAIINEEPIRDSIKDIGGVWRRHRHAVFGGNLTLNNIEHDVLREDFNEPRIHAALVCAALSCPPLRAEPFTAEALDTQLDDQVERWLAKEDGLHIDREEGIVYVSKIFDWFTRDWEPTYGLADGDERFTGRDSERAVLNFISGYISEDDRTYLEAGDYDLKYFDYDWSLNIQS